MHWSKEEQCHLSRGASTSKLNWVFITKASDAIHIKRINTVRSEMTHFPRETCHTTFHNLKTSQLAREHYWGQRILNFIQVRIQETPNTSWPQTGRAFKLLSSWKTRPNLLGPGFESSQMYCLPYNTIVVDMAKMCTKLIFWNGRW